MIAEHRRYGVRPLLLPLDLRHNPRVFKRKKSFGVVCVVANSTLPGSLIFQGPIALPPLHPVRISALDLVGREGDPVRISALDLVGREGDARAAALGG
jgi:hypothetical protein